MRGTEQHPEVSDISKNNGSVEKENNETAINDIGDELEQITDECVAENVQETDNSERDLEKVVDEYLADLKKNAAFPDTISNEPFKVEDLERKSPEENELSREEFDDKKTQLKREWEEKNGRDWPKYDHDIYSASGKLIRKEGQDYDAHHIHPLGMGGENTADNITPINVEVHYDRQGVHAPNSPYSRMDKILGGEEE